MQTQLSPRPTASWLIAIILGVAALHWLKVLAVPMAFALFLMALVWPLHRKLERRAPAGVAVLVSVLLLVAAAAGMGRAEMTNVSNGKPPTQRWRFKSGNTLTRHLIVLGAAAALIYLFGAVRSLWSPMNRWNRDRKSVV